jgi:hypothetical protein
MRLLPFTLRDVLVLVGATALPVVPLVLAAMPLEEVVSRLSKVIL